MKKVSELPELLTLEEVSKLLKCHPNTLRQWDKNGILPAVRMGKRGVRKYRKVDLERFMNTTPSTQPLSQSEFQQLIMNAPVGFGIVNNKFEFVALNEKLAQMNNLPISEHIGKSVEEVISPVYWKKLSPIYKKALKGKNVEPFEIYGPQVREPKQFAYYKVSVYQMRLPGNQKGVGMLVQDITEEKIIDETVRESEEQFRNLATELKRSEEQLLAQQRYITAVTESTSEGILGINKNGDVTFINSAALKLLGFTEKEVLGKNAHELFHYKYPDGRPYPVADNPFIKAFNDGKPTEFIEETFWHKDGTPILVLSSCSPIILDGRIIGGVIAIIDLRQHKIAQDALRQVESRFETLIEQSPVSIQIFNTDGFTIKVNKAWKELWGTTLKKIAGYNILKDQQLVENGVMSFIKKGFYGQASEVPVIEYFPEKTIPGGSSIRSRWVKAFIYPVKDDKGNVREVVLMHEDVTDEMRANEELKRYQERLELAQSAGRIGVFESDLRTGQVWLSKQQALLYGFEESLTVDRQTLRALIHQEDVDTREQIIADAIQNHTDFETEFRVKQLGGGYRWLKGRGHIFYDVAGKPGRIVGVNYDITQRKLEEEALSFKAEAGRILSSSLDFKSTLAQIAELAVDHIADWCSVEMLTEEGEVELLHVAHKDPKKVKWAKRLRTKHPVNMNEPGGLQTVLQTGETLFVPIVTKEMVEAAVKTKEDRKLMEKIGFESVLIVPLKSKGKPIGAIQIISTESKIHFSEIHKEMAEQLASKASLAIENAQLYQEVANERERLTNLLANVPSVVWEAWGKPDESNQRIDFVSDHVERMLGYTKEEWLSTPNFWLTIVHPDDKTRAGEEAAAMFSSGQGGVSRFRWITKKGKEIWVEGHSYVITNKKGIPLGMRGVTMDITDRIKEEQRKDDFISMASHELKTPVTSIKAFTQILHRMHEKRGETESVKYLSRMDTQINKLTHLISDLLDVSRIQQGRLQFHYEKFSFSELLKEVVENIQATSSSHTLIINHNVGASVTADRDRIGQVITNLLTNAIKYSPKSKRVEIESLIQGGELVVSVKDKGVGIPPTRQDKIFQRFYRAHEESDQRFPGLGIGLYISKQIVDRHGGKMWLKSSEGKGSTFYFSLPLKFKSR